MTRKIHTIISLYCPQQVAWGSIILCAKLHRLLFILNTSKCIYIYTMVVYHSPPETPPTDEQTNSLVIEREKGGPRPRGEWGEKNTTSPHRRLIIKINLPTSAPDHKTSHLVFMRPSFSLINPVPIVNLQKKTKCFLIFIAFANLFSFHSTAKFLP